MKTFEEILKESNLKYPQLSDNLYKAGMLLLNSRKLITEQYILDRVNRIQNDIFTLIDELKSR
jgi:hypothetical protein